MSSLVQWQPTFVSDNFEVSSNGEVRRCKPYVRPLRTPATSVTIEGRTCTVSRLVATAFLPNPDNLPIVLHVDGDPRNNRVDNLRWASRADWARLRLIKAGGLVIGEQDAQQIRDRVGTPYEQIAEELSIPKSIVRNVLLGKSWRP